MRMFILICIPEVGKSAIELVTERHEARLRELATVDYASSNKRTVFNLSRKEDFLFTDLFHSLLKLTVRLLTPISVSIALTKSSYRDLSGSSRPSSRSVMRRSW